MHRIGTRMYVSRRDVFRKGAKPFRNCFPSPPSHRLPFPPTPRKTRQPTHPRHEPLIYVSYETCANHSPSPSLDSIISLDLPFISTNISRPLPLFSTYLPLSPSKLLQKARKKKEREIYKIEIARFCFRETRGKDRTRDIRLDFLGSRGCGKLLLRAVVGRLERRK